MTVRYDYEFAGQHFETEYDLTRKKVLFFRTNTRIEEVKEL